MLRGLPLRVGPAEARPGGPPDETTVASLDSELALVLAPPATLAGWAPNPLFRIAPPPPDRPAPLGPPATPARPLLVARLDAPSLDAALALVDRAIEGEKNGLGGLFCFDARGLKSRDAYGLYDQRIRDAAALARTAGLKVKLDDRSQLFGPNDCPGTAFYIGWYALGRYADAFTFEPGAIAFHVASSECVSMRDPNLWVPGLLSHGAAATIGPVAEPYLASFPDPVAFLARLLDGRATLAEIYWQTVPQASWRQVLVGDPLYRPRVRR